MSLQGGYPQGYDGEGDRGERRRPAVRLFWPAGDIHPAGAARLATGEPDDRARRRDVRRIRTAANPDATTTAGAPSVEHVPFASVDATLAAVRAGEVDYAVVPIENSVEGGSARPWTISPTGIRSSSSARCSSR